MTPFEDAYEISNNRLIMIEENIRCIFVLYQSQMQRRASISSMVAARKFRKLLGRTIPGVASSLAQLWSKSNPEERQ